MTHQLLWVSLCCLPEKGRKEIEEIVEEMKEKGQARKRKINESEETEEITTCPLFPYLLQGQQALPNCKPVSVGCPGDIRYTTPSPHPTTPQSIVSFKSMLFIKMLTVLVSTISNSQVFLFKKCQ